MGMSYAVIWTESADAVRAGELVVHSDRLVLHGARGREAVRRVIDFGSVHSIRINREPSARLDGRPVAELETDIGMIRIALLPGRGELTEIVGLVGSAIPGAKAAIG